MNSLNDLISKKTGLSTKTVAVILKLLEEGSTIPFIARYRKEMTGGATDEQLREFESIYAYSKKLLERKEEVSRLIAERSELNNDLRTRLNNAQTLQEIEDIYRPFKEKKNTRASVAIAAGLEPLADILERAQMELGEFNKCAESFVKGSITSRDEAIKGAQDILAERYSDEARERDYWRRQILDYSSFEIKGTKSLSEEGLFAKLAGKSEKIASIPSHRYLAIMRGVSEKELNVKITLDMDRVENTIKNYRIPRHAKSSLSLLLASYLVGFTRLLFPSLEREVHAIIKERSDLQAINTFGKNLSQLLGSPPVTKRSILGADPAYRTGCKLAVVDENGMYLDHAVIYPTPPQSDYEKSAKVVKELAKRYGFNAVAIGNGTASRETQEFFARLNRDEGLNLAYTVVSEAGASVYSASKIAQEEYPQLDVTIRGAISIAQRLRDPMAALVKIDPKSIGVGQYQHDVDQKKLKNSLDKVVESSVNMVGVNVNTASQHLLTYISGLGPQLAQNIVDYRKENGPFNSRTEIQKVARMGAKAFEQAAGFLRIPDAANPLDNSAVHPESYFVVQKIAKDLKCSIQELISNEELQKQVVWPNYVTDKIGLPTLEDIKKELAKPGRDPRSAIKVFEFAPNIYKVEDLQVGMVLPGIVTNITKFGAFVDVGVKQDGLVHVSQMADRFISDPSEIVKLHEHVHVKVIELDLQRKRIQLSLKQVPQN